MFSGLVREIAKVKSFQNNILTLECSYKPKIGDSIAINGACLTATQLHKDGFSVEISKHSQLHLALENYKDKVHIEPALSVDSRFDGHFVQGHIDAIGTIKAIQKQDNQVRFEISAPHKALMLIIPQGSITIDGISLTISQVGKESFGLTIIPHTFANTLFHTYKINRRVNIETDVLVRSVAHILSRHNQESSMHSWAEIDKILMQY